MDLAEITDPAYPGERLMVCRNPILAEERDRRRNELLDRTEQELEVIQGAVDRPKKPLRGAGEIGKKVGAILAHYQTGRFFDLRITDFCLSFHRKTQLIQEDSALDGFYVIRTSVGPETLTAAAAVKAYKELSHVETAFRLLKTVDLEIRPIYHALSDRVRAHAFLCMLAYYLEWHLRRDLAPLLFAEEDPEARQSTRKTIVSPTRATPGRLDQAQQEAHGGGLSRPGLPRRAQDPGDPDPTDRPACDRQTPDLPAGDPCHSLPEASL